MNTKTASAFLKCHGPKQLEAPNRSTRAALKAARKSPDFDTTHDEQKKVDAIAAEKLSIAIPDDLLVAINEIEAKMSEPTGRSSASVKNPAFLVVALAFLAMVGLVTWLTVSHLDEFPGMEEAISIAEAGDLSQPSQFDALSATLGSLDDWFVMQGFDGFKIPAAISSYGVVGVRVFEFEGINVAMAVVPDNRSFVYVFPSHQLGISPGESGSWRILEYGKQSAPRVMGISEIGNYCLVVTFEGNRRGMEQFLRGPKPR